MSDHDLHTFMAQIASEMGSEYGRIFARASEDPGTAGDEGEQNWAELLQAWLPPAYHVATKGRLIGHDGRMSPQIDVVVLKPAYPQWLRKKRIWLAGGVAAVFECKTTISAAHVADSMNRCARFKDLYPTREGTPYLELRSPLIYGLLAHSYSWKGERSEPITNINRGLDSGMAGVTHPRYELDVLCVADLATWSSEILSRYEAAWRPEVRVELEEAFGAACGPMTTMCCSSTGSEGQQASFQPVGALLDSLIRRLAWADPGIRDIADYFRRANLGGSGFGEMRPWPLTTYSPDVAKEIKAGRRTNQASWDEWSVAGW